MTRKFIVLDCEATQEVKTRECRPDAALVYDLGWIVTDGETVYERRSLVISDVYFTRAMETAYYTEKLPKYAAGLLTGEWVMTNMVKARELFAEDCANYGVREVWAYNCKYDRVALAHTCEVLSNGFCREFFPAGVKVRDIWGAAGSTICATVKYVEWCAANGYVSAKGNPTTNAEIVTRYLTGEDFIEAHTALADCEIELAILMAAKKRKQKMDTREGMGWREAAKIAKGLANS